MAGIDIKKLSGRYAVRKLEQDDIPRIASLCRSNTQYYACCGKAFSPELIENDLTMTPPGIPMAQKHYIGFFECDRLVAVMDVIEGYPTSAHAYIGFFMVARALQGRGVGSRIVSEALDCLSRHGFRKCQLGIDRDNPQACHFWRKNGFEVIREAATENGVILVAEKQC